MLPTPLALSCDVSPMRGRRRVPADDNGDAFCSRRLMPLSAELEARRVSEHHRASVANA